MTNPSWHSLHGETLLEEIPHGVVILDRDLKIVRHNHAFAEIFGPSHGKYCFEVYKDQTEPVLEYYKSRVDGLVAVDGSKKIDEITAEIIRALQ